MRLSRVDANEGMRIIGKKRFTCLSPTLVRMEFAPDGNFEERRSMVAYAQRNPQPFASVREEGPWTVLNTGLLEIRSRAGDAAFNCNSLEIRWSDGKLLQSWRPGDRDYQNLGGTLRSLDRYGGDCSELDGVHPATLESPDVSANNWPAWLQCEVEPLYTKLHPKPPDHFNRGNWLRSSKNPYNDGTFLERTWNWYKDARRFCPGVLSASGYFLLNDSDSAVLDADDFPVERFRPGYQDWYFFGYGKNYKQALRDFRLLSGPAPLLTHRSFGIAFSRWPAFAEEEVVALVQDFAANGYPLSALAMDMEWHKEGWGHWEFNPDLIPDPKRFFALFRKHGLEVMFNDHPLDVRDDDCHYAEYVRRAGPDLEIREREYNGKTLKMAKVDICNKQQNRAFCEVCHPRLLELGLDYWWNDGSRGQLSGTAGQLVANKTFFEEAARGDRRGMLLGRYGGLGSHRYGVSFTGDTLSDFHALKLECEFNIRAGGVGVSNVSHDIGGFFGGDMQKNAAGDKIITPERYVRWLQFGVFNSVLRLHCHPDGGSRKPYDYDDMVGGACRHWLRVRHGLLPYIYTAAWEHHATGIPVVRGMYLEEPENPDAYRFDQYYFGPAMLVAPVLSPVRKRSIYLPQGEWWEFETAKRVNGGVELTRPVGLSEVPVYVKAGSIIPRQDPDMPLHEAHIQSLFLDTYPGADGGGELYEDDGRSPDYQRGSFCRTRFQLRQEGGTVTITGRVVEGKPFGATREITITVALGAAPGQVQSAGRTLTAEPCGEGRYRVRLPAVPAKEPFEVTIV